MLRHLMFLLVSLVALTAVPAYARISYPCADNSTNCGGYTLPTGPGDFETSGPSIISCTAEGTYNQQCRYCQADHFWDGTISGYTCGYVKNNAACRCGIGTVRIGCSTEGICTYISPI